MNKTKKINQRIFTRKKCKFNWRLNQTKQQNNNKNENKKIKQPPTNAKKNSNPKNNKIFQI